MNCMFRSVFQISSVREGHGLVLFMLVVKKSLRNKYVLQKLSGAAQWASVGRMNPSGLMLYRPAVGQISRLSSYSVTPANCHKFTGWPNFHSLIFRWSYSAFLRTYIHTYIHTCIHTYIHACIHTYILSYKNAYMHTYIYTYIHTYMHAYIHIYMLKYIHIYLLKYIHTYIHKCIYAYVHIYMLKYIHTYIYTHYVHKYK